jgi:hypothetical protein
MPIHIGEAGTAYVGKEAIDLYRMATLLHGLNLEMVGLRLTNKAPTCYSIIKREYGFKGNRAKVLAQFEAYFSVMKSKITITED